MFLLGKLGKTDVRVTRKGDDIEVKVGDDVHELIRMGAPYEMGNDGQGRREEPDDAMEGHDRGREIPSGGDGPQGEIADQGDLPDLRGEPPGPEQGDGEGLPGSGGCAGAEEAGEEGEDGAGSGDLDPLEAPYFFGEGSETLEDEV